MCRVVFQHFFACFSPSRYYNSAVEHINTLLGPNFAPYIYIYCKCKKKKKLIANRYCCCIFWHNEQKKKARYFYDILFFSSYKKEKGGNLWPPKSALLCNIECFALCGFSRSSSTGKTRPCPLPPAHLGACTAKLVPRHRPFGLQHHSPPSLIFLEYVPFPKQNLFHKCVPQSTKERLMSQYRHHQQQQVPFQPGTYRCNRVDLDEKVRVSGCRWQPHLEMI